MARWEGTDFRTDYQLDVPELSEHWEEVVQDLHASGCPVAHGNNGEAYWVINRDADVRRCARDWEAFISSEGFMPNRPEGAPLWFPDECDPPLHDEIRGPLNRFLSPRAISGLEPEIRRHASDLIDAFAAEGTADIVSQYSNVLPGLVFFDLIAGMPLDDVPALQRDLHLGLLGPPEGRGAAFQRVLVYMDRYLTARRDAPRRGDIVNAILDLEIDGYGWADRCGTLAQLTLGGVSTSGHVIASAIRLLAEDRELRDQLRSAQPISQRAIEEFIRAFASSVNIGRRVTRDVEVADTHIAKGAFVLLSFGAACRDPEVFQSPERVDVDRFPNPHVAFGTGIHRCIGSHLARLQIRVALEVFLERIPEFRVEPGFVPQFETGTVRSMKSLMMKFCPATEMRSS